MVTSVQVSSGISLAEEPILGGLGKGGLITIIIVAIIFIVVMVWIFRNLKKWD